MFKSVLAHASCVFDITGFGEIGEMTRLTTLRRQTCIIYSSSAKQYYSKKITINLSDDVKIFMPPPPLSTGGIKQPVCPRTSVSVCESVFHLYIS